MFFHRVEPTMGPGVQGGSVGPARHPNPTGFTGDGGGIGSRSTDPAAVSSSVYQQPQLQYQPLYAQEYHDTMTQPTNCESMPPTASYPSKMVSPGTSGTYYDPITPPAAYHDTMTPPAAYVDPMAPPAAYHDVSNASMVYHDTTKAQFSYQDKMMQVAATYPDPTALPTSAYHDKTTQPPTYQHSTRPSALFHDSSVQATTYHGSNSPPTVAYSHVAAPRLNSPQDIGRIDTKQGLSGQGYVGFSGESPAANTTPTWGWAPTATDSQEIPPSAQTAVAARQARTLYNGLMETDALNSRRYNQPHFDHSSQQQQQPLQRRAPEKLQQQQQPLLAEPSPALRSVQQQQQQSRYTFYDGGNSQQQQQQQPHRQPGPHQRVMYPQEYQKTSRSFSNHNPGAPFRGGFGGGSGSESFQTQQQQQQSQHAQRQTGPSHRGSYAPEQQRMMVCPQKHTRQFVNQAQNISAPFRNGYGNSGTTAQYQQQQQGRNGVGRPTGDSLGFSVGCVGTPNRAQFIAWNRQITSPNMTCASIVNLAIENGSRYNAVNWSTTFHRLAKLFMPECKSHSNAPILRRLLAQVSGNPRLLYEFEPQHLATIAWSMAKLGIVDFDLMQGIVQQAHRHTQDSPNKLKPQDMANLLWAMAKIPYADEQLFKMVAERCEKEGSELMSRFKPQEMASVLWSVASAKLHSCLVVFEVVSEEAMARNLHDFSPQAMANIMWAMGKMNYQHPRLYRLIASHMVRDRLEGFKPQELANVLAAISGVSSRSYPPSEPLDPQIARLFEEVARHLLAAGHQGFQGYDPQAITNIVWALQQTFPALLTQELLSLVLQKLVHALTNIPPPPSGTKTFSAAQLSSLAAVVVRNQRSQACAELPRFLSLVSQVALEEKLVGWQPRVVSALLVCPEILTGRKTDLCRMVDAQALAAATDVVDTCEAADFVDLVVAVTRHRQKQCGADTDLKNMDSTFDSSNLYSYCAAKVTSLMANGISDKENAGGIPWDMLAKLVWVLVVEDPERTDIPDSILTRFHADITTTEVANPPSVYAACTLVWSLCTLLTDDDATRSESPQAPAVALLEILEKVCRRFVMHRAIFSAQEIHALVTGICIIVRKGYTAARMPVQADFIEAAIAELTSTRLLSTALPTIGVSVLRHLLPVQAKLPGGQAALRSLVAAISAHVLRSDRSVYSRDDLEIVKRAQDQLGGTDAEGHGLERDETVGAAAGKSSHTRANSY